MKQWARIHIVLMSVCVLVSSAAGSESARQALLRQDWAVAATMAATDRSAFPPASVALLSGYAAFSRGGWFAAWESLSRLAQDDQKEELLKWAEGLLAGNQKSAVAWMIAGDARTRLGKYNEGVQALKCALDLDSSLILAIEIRALVHLFSGDAKAAEADFQEVAKRDPRLKDDATYGLAALSLQLGEYDNSIRSFTTLLEANPGHFLARNARAVAYSMLGDYRSAEDDFDRVLREVPSFRVPAANRELMRMARARGIFKMEQIMAMASPKGTLGSIVMVIAPRGAILDSAIIVDDLNKWT